MKNFILFPTLTKELYEKAGMYCEPYKFSYHGSNKKVVNLEYDFENNEYIIFDEKMIWNVVEYDLSISTQLTIENPEVLFGANGIAPTNSKIQVALQWMSKPSNKRDTIYVMDFDRNTEKIDKSISFSIKKDMLRNFMDLQIILTIGDVETPIKRSENFLASQKGAVLGTFNAAKVMLEGKGSEFPIVVNDLGENKPLWQLLYSSEDPMVDKFIEENVCLAFNSGHPSFKVLDLENMNESTQLFKEIFSTSIVMILQHLKDEDCLEATIKNEDLQEGSICSAMHYFIKTFNIDTSNLDKMMQSVKENIDKRL